MNPPPAPGSDTPPPSRKLTWLWVLLAVFTLTSASVIIVGVKMLRKSGGTAPDEARAQAGGAITPIDLTPFYDKSGSWITGSEWQQAPRGSIVLGGVPFEMNGLLRLSGRRPISPVELRILGPLHPERQVGRVSQLALHQERAIALGG